VLPVELSSPFGDEPLEEIPLASSPLERVIAQVVLPRLARLSPEGEDGEAIAALVNGLSASYPVFNETNELNFRIDPNGVTPEKGPLMRQFQSADTNWTATIAPTSIGIETTAYETRAQFVQRFASLLETVGAAVGIPDQLRVARVGVRYVNRVSDRALVKEAHAFVRPEASGGLAVQRPEHVNLVHTMNDSLFHLGGDRMLQARWGILPSGMVNLPGVAGLPTASWILDMDSYSNEPTQYEPPALAGLVEAMAASAYRYFRWLVTPHFLSTFGAQT
jgi:uncharacterized protein (TIGR04255 family)